LSTEFQRQPERKTVLVFEALPVLRDSIAALVVSSGRFRAFEGSGSIDEAMAKIGVAEPDLVVMGPLMGNYAVGDEAVVELVSHIVEASPKSKVLMLIEQDNLQLVRGGINAGASGVVSMSDPTSEFISGVESVVDGGFYIAPRLALLLVRSGREPTSDLTDNESIVLKSVALGVTNLQIAESMDISVRSVESHRQQVMEKLKLDNRADLVRYALDHSLIG
jgi:DNA-binding NarL/FixJ family response regulator